MTATEIIFEEAKPGDAAAFLAFMQQVSQETDYLLMTESDLDLTVTQVSEIFKKSLEAADQLCLIAKKGTEIIGVINIRTSSFYRLSHIGDVFLAVQKAYWGHGIGKILMEEALIWVEENGLLTRLELTVQTRNARAVHIYQKFGFEIEGTMRLGARTNEGEYLDVYAMAKLIEA